MGAKCCNAHKQLLQSTETNNTRSQFHSSKKLISMYIDAFTIKPHTLAQISKTNKTSQYTYILTLPNTCGPSDSVIFVPKLGFIKETPNQQQSHYSIAFQLSKLQHNNVKLQIKPVTDLKLWKKIPSQGIIINENQQISIGTFSFLLKHIITKDQISSRKHEKKQKYKKCKQQNIQCRHCYADTKIQQNFLIMPCQCAGSLSAIHLLCLTNWIFQGDINQQISNGKISKIKVKQAYCQICKSSFEEFIYHQIVKKLTWYHNVNYVMFELNNIMDKQQKQENKRTYIVFKFDNQTQCAKIGSSKQCQFTKHDSTLSPINTSLFYNKGKIKVIDNLSKYGTFIRSPNRQLQPNIIYRMLNLFFTVHQLVAENSNNL